MSSAAGGLPTVSGNGVTDDVSGGLAESSSRLANPVLPEPEPSDDAELDAIASRSKRRRRGSRVIWVWRVAILLALVGVWQLVATYKIIKPVLARTPRQTWDYLYQSAASGDLWMHTGSTLTAVFIAFVLASFVGIVVGLILGMLHRVERVLGPFLDAANSMPRIALAPVFIVYFGITTEAKVTLAFSVVVFIALSATLAGVRGVDPEMLRLSTVLGSTKMQLFRYVYLPTAVPAIFGALRLGLVYSLLGVVASEMIAARSGLGLLVAQEAGVFRMEGVYGILIVLALVAVILNQAMASIERWILRWRPPVDR